MMRKSCSAIVVVLLLAGLVLSGCGQPESVEVGVRLKWLYFPNYSGAVMARERGFFPSEWTVEINQGGFEANSITMVESGSDMFGVTSALELMQARARGASVVAICADFHKSPISFLTLPESGITTVEQFVGKRVGMKHGTNTELIHRALLATCGIDPADLIEVPVKFSTLPLVEGDVDVFPSYYMTDPVNLEARGFSVNTINPDQYGIECYGNVLITAERTIEEQPEIVRRFTEAYVQGWMYAVEHVEETARVFTDLNETTPIENHIEILRRTEPYLHLAGGQADFGRMTIEKWQSSLALLSHDEGWGELPGSGGFDVTRCFTNEFLPE